MSIKVKERSGFLYVQKEGVSTYVSLGTESFIFASLQHLLCSSFHTSEGVCRSCYGLVLHFNIVLLFIFILVINQLIINMTWPSVIVWVEVHPQIVGPHLLVRSEDPLSCLILQRGQKSEAS